MHNSLRIPVRPAARDAAHGRHKADMAAAHASWLPRAAVALREADALLFHAGAGMGVDSGLPDFRGPQGFWRAYPPMKDLGLQFSDCSNPRSFQKDPRFGWGFMGHRYQLYTGAQPHEGYHILKPQHGHFVFTSNVDGHFLRAGFAEDKVVECHGSIHYLQAMDKRESVDIWPAAPHLAGLRVDPATFLADAEGLPYCPLESGAQPGHLARPNILMFGDWGWVESRADAQEKRYSAFEQSLPRSARVVVIEVGAGMAIPTVRNMSENILDDFPNATLLRINPAEPQGPGNTVEIPVGGLEALSALDRELGGAAGIGAARKAS